MRSILKKINRRAPLDSDEYRRLVEYFEGLRHSSPESYALFYHDYADVLFRGYRIWLPRFAVDIDDLINLIIEHPALLSSLEGEHLDPDSLPMEYQALLREILGQADSRRLFGQVVQIMQQPASGQNVLPRPREGTPVYIYEDANPFKEIGLKTHFERLGRFGFITRLQSYRYLTRHNSGQDRIHYISSDCLGGIFSNKEKSIYYYIFLSEADQLKAENAARLLNLALYEKGGGA